MSSPPRFVLVPEHGYVIFSIWSLFLKCKLAISRSCQCKLQQTLETEQRRKIIVFIVWKFLLSHGKGELHNSGQEWNGRWTSGHICQKLTITRIALNTLRYNHRRCRTFRTLQDTEKKKNSNLWPLAKCFLFGTAYIKNLIFFDSIN